MRARIWAAILVGTLGCESEEVDPVAAFVTPTGLAVAGTATDGKGNVIHRLFVSNNGQDTLQVLNLGEDLTKVEFVFGPAQRVPLRIPAGSGPADLAATLDGRYVVVLDLISESLRLVDADSLLLVRDEAGTVLQLPLGPSGSSPSAMVASPVACGEGCRGRVYVTLGESGAVVGVDVIDGANGPRLVTSRQFGVGGEPASLAIRGDGRVLFATDSASAELIRIDLETGAFERRALGGIGGPVAVSTDGTAVVVGRPNERDLVVFRDADGGLELLDANSAWAPRWQCREECDQPDSNRCENAHPADWGVCETEAGIESVGGEEYEAVYIGDIPTHIVALGHGAGQPSIASECNVGSAASRQEFAEFVAVALLDGNVIFLGLRRGADDPIAPELVSLSFCLDTTLKGSTVDPLNQVVDESVALDNYLGTCPAVPDDRARLQCIQTTVDTVAGVVISPGTTTRKTWQLAWEGALVDRTEESGPGGGAGLIEQEAVGETCTADAECLAGTLCDTEQGACVASVFTDAPAEVSAVRGCETISGVRCELDTDPGDIAYPGDLLTIRTEPTSTCRATPCAGTTALDWRVFERTILAVVETNDRTRLELDRAIEPGCFHEGSELEYRIRANRRWLVSASNESGFYRVSPGQRFGLAGDVGRARTEMFDVLPRVVPNVSLSSCDLYTVAVDADEDGENEVDDGLVICDDPAFLPGDAGCVPIVDPELARGRKLRISITDPFSVFRSGRSIDYAGNASGTAGRVPGGMIVSGVGAEEPVVFLSYAGSNGVLGFVPFDVNEAFSEVARYTLLQ